MWKPLKKLYKLQIQKGKLLTKEKELWKFIKENEIMEEGKYFLTNEPIPSRVVDMKKFYNKLCEKYSHRKDPLELLLSSSTTTIDVIKKMLTPEDIHDVCEKKIISKLKVFRR